MVLTPLRKDGPLLFLCLLFAVIHYMPNMGPSLVRAHALSGRHLMSHFLLGI